MTPGDPMTQPAALTDEEMAEAVKLASQIIAATKTATPGTWDNKTRRNDHTGEFLPGRSVVTSYRMPHKTYAENFDDPEQRVQPFPICSTPAPSCYDPEKDAERAQADAAYIVAAQPANAASVAQALLAATEEVTRLTGEREQSERDCGTYLAERDMAQSEVARLRAALEPYERVTLAAKIIYETCIGRREGYMPNVGAPLTYALRDALEAIYGEYPGMYEGPWGVALNPQTEPKP